MNTKLYIRRECKLPPSHVSQGVAYLQVVKVKYLKIQFLLVTMNTEMKLYVILQPLEAGKQVVPI